MTYGTLAVSRTRVEISDIQKSLDNEDKPKLNRIISIIQNSLNPKKIDDANAILILAEELGLNDLAVINKCDKNSVWVEIYNKYRNLAIHEGYFIAENEINSSDFLPLYYHLRDLLIRIVLKRLKYNGIYNCGILGRGEISVDWVKIDTPWDCLWLKKFIEEHKN